MTLKEARKAIGFSQEILSELSGVTQAQISRIENGAYFPMESTQIALQKAINIKIDFIQTRVEGKRFAAHTYGEDVGSEERLFGAINEYIKSGTNREEQKKSLKLVERFIKSYKNNFYK